MLNWLMKPARRRRATLSFLTWDAGSMAQVFYSRKPMGVVLVDFEHAEQYASFPTRNSRPIRWIYELSAACGLVPPHAGVRANYYHVDGRALAPCDH